MNDKVMVAGHICLDVAPRFESAADSLSDIFVPGKLVNIGDAVLCTGGAVSNTGLSMAKLGMDVRLNGKVGDDEFGSIIKSLVGPDRAIAFKTVAGESTSYTVILAVPGVDRIFLHHTGTNDTFTANDIDYEAAGECSLFHFGYPPLMAKMYSDGGDELCAIYKRVKQLGVMTSLDMSLPDPANASGKADWKAILKKVLPYVDIFLPSIDELMFMLEPEQCRADGYSCHDFDRLSGLLLDMGVKIVGIKAGCDGLYLRTADRTKISAMGKSFTANSAEWSGRQMWCPTYKVEKIGSATGAGDATIAGFLCGLLHGLEPGDAIRVANTVGGQNVTQIDALSGIQDWATTQEMVADKSRGYNQLSLELNGWRKQKCGVLCGPNDQK
jgi:sugar/nucleoside kinase (ribokinase family)